jgi:hypothetical protein
MKCTDEDAFLTWLATPLVLDGKVLRGRSRLKQDRAPLPSEWRTERCVLNGNALCGDFDAAEAH